MKTRWTCTVAAVSLAVLPNLAVSPAWADECPPLDVTCLADGTLGGGQDAVDDAVGTVDPVVEDTLDDVDQLLGGGGEPPPGGGGNGGGGGGGGNGGGGPGGGSGAGDGVTIPLMPSGAGFRGAADSPVVLSTLSIGEQPSLPERLAIAATGAVQSLAVVLMLLGVAVGFVLIQDRLDKRDPRLTLAPIHSDFVRFA